MSRKPGRLPRPEQRPMPLPIASDAGRGHYTWWPLRPPRKQPARETQDSRADDGRTEEE